MISLEAQGADGVEDRRVEGADEQVPLFVPPRWLNEIGITRHRRGVWQCQGCQVFWKATSTSRKIRQIKKMLFWH